MTQSSRPITAVTRAAFALAMSVITGATAGLALARWPVTKSAPS